MDGSQHIPVVIASAPVSLDGGTDGQALGDSVADPESFRVIFSRYHAPMFGYVARRVGAVAAADVTSEVFLRAFRLRERFDPSRTSCRAWLYAIATNVIGDHLRRERRRRRHPFAVAGSTAGGTDAFEDADDRIDATMLAPHLQEALGFLRAADREVLLLYALSGLSYQDIAEALRIPIGTVRSRLSRARRQVRARVPEVDGPQDGQRPAGVR